MGSVRSVLNWARRLWTGGPTDGEPSQESRTVP